MIKSLAAAALIVLLSGKEGSDIFKLGTGKG